MTPDSAGPVLVYDRIAHNRRKTVLLVAIAAASIAPSVLALSFGCAATIAYRLASGYPPRPDTALELRLMAVFALGLIGGLALLFWAVASSPVAKVLAFAGARPAGPQEAEAKRLLENLAIGAGLPNPRLYVIDTATPNGFAAGMHPSDSVVAVTTGLLSLMDRRELEGVLAHELSHIGNHDTRLNTIIASLVLFLRLTYLMRRQGIQESRQAVSTSAISQYRSYRLLFSPLFLYLFFVAPVLAALIRSAVSRNREYLADADAALLTRYPEGLLRALTKIAGAGSAMAGSNPVVEHLYFADPAPGAAQGLLNGRLFATHPPIQHRIQKLAEFNSGISVSELEAALEAGREFGKNHPAAESVGMLDSVTSDELAMFTEGNPMGRVFRYMEMEPAPIYDQPNPNSSTVARLQPGALIVAFDDPGPYRQVNTADQTFGYLRRKVKLQAVNLTPADLYDPASRAAAERDLPPFTPESAGPVNPATSLTAQAISGKQIFTAVVFGVLVFGGVLLLLMRFSG
jgi:heat shock protein HtpX